MWKRFLIGSVLVVLAVAAATASSLLLAIDTTAQRLRCLPGTECRKIQRDLTPTYGGAPQTLLILGSDRRKSDRKAGLPPRSDTIILIRLDPDGNAVRVINLPRDLKVNIPGHGVDKINAAYTIGGPRLTLKVIKNLTGLEVNHVINIDFKGFKKSVNQIGCVFMDVDRRYYHSNAGLPPSQQYAEINIPAGYQRLCGQKALDYARFRHDDNDLVRGARQDEFLREARRQITVSKLIEQRQKLIDIFVKYTTSDIRGTEPLLAVVKLSLASAGKPIEQVRFPTGRVAFENSKGASYVVIPERSVRAAVGRFLGEEDKQGVAAGAAGQQGTEQRAKKKDKRKKKKPGAKQGGDGLINVAAQGSKDAAIVRTKTTFPVMYPTRITANAQFYGNPRVYTISQKRGGGGKKWKAVKIVIRTNDYQYYGVMETTWKDPPILRDHYDTVKLGGRTFRVYYEAGKVRLVALITPRATYWVSNTLSKSLTAKQMLTIAKSLRSAS